MPDDPILRSFQQIMLMPNNGDWHDTALVEHSELIKAMNDFVIANNAPTKGSFTITLSYSLDRTLTMKVNAETTVKLPKQPKATATLWTTREGELTPANPAQASMFEIRDVTPKNTANVRNL